MHSWFFLWATFSLNANFYLSVNFHGIRASILDISFLLWDSNSSFTSQRSSLWDFASLRTSYICLFASTTSRISPSWAKAAISLVKFLFAFPYKDAWWRDPCGNVSFRKQMVAVSCAQARPKIAPIYFLSARWSSPCKSRLLLEELTSRRGTPFGNQSARCLSGGRQSGRLYSPHYGRYGSTRMRSTSGVKPSPLMRYSTVRARLQDPGISVARPTRG